MGVVDRMKKAWNAFTSDEESQDPSYSSAPVYGAARPDRRRLSNFNDRTIITALLVRMAVDVSGVNLRHIETTDAGHYKGDKDSKLNDVLNIESNLDQGPRAFRQDIVMTLVDHGVAAIVPVDAIRDAETGGLVDILTMRVGYIVGWAPKHVRVMLYNEERGVQVPIWLEKQSVAIVENPFYAVMNQQNSTLQRLIRKLNLLDVVDEKAASGKLDLIIQLPYTIKSEAKRAEAQRRRADIEEQLTGSTYGIAYSDATEKIVQLNRPVENNLLKQVEFLRDMLYGEMGVTREIMDGTADEKAMINYFDRTVEPLIDAIAEAMRRTFIGNKKNEKVAYFRNPFKLVPMSELSDVIDKLSRNEVLSPNEVRSFMGIPPSEDPKADELRNSNMPQPLDPIQGGFAAQEEQEGQHEV